MNNIVLPYIYIYLRCLLLKECNEEDLSYNIKKYLYPLDNNAGIYGKNYVSLTDSIENKHKIRYNLKERTFRIINDIIELLNTNGVKLIKFPILLLDSEISAYFISTLNKRDIKVELTNDIDINYTNEEAVLIEALLNKENKINILLQYLEMYIYSNDLYTAESLLDSILSSYSLDIKILKEYYHLFGVLKTSLGKYSEAAYWYSLSINFASTEQKISTYYNLAMIYLRHNHSIFLNFNKGESLLNEGLKLLRSNKQLFTKDSYIFSYIFNRNGYSLIESKQKKFYKVKKRLQIFIKILNANKENPKFFMHMSVILYNLCQIYKFEKDYNNAIKHYKQLLQIDGYYPEYLCELALIYIDLQDIKKARYYLDQALKYDKNNPMAYYLKSIITDNQENKLIYSQQAYLNSNKDYIYYNYIYNLYKANRVNKLDKLLIKPNNTAKDILAIKANIMLKNQKLDDYNLLVAKINKIWG